MTMYKKKRCFAMLPEEELYPDEIKMVDAAKYLGKSTRSITRYIKNGWIRPKKINSKNGTLEYRFDGSDLSRFKEQYDEVYERI